MELLDFTLNGGTTMTEERLPLNELLQKAGDGDFLRAVAESVLQLLWQRELDYSLRKGLWGFHENRIAVRFQYECHDDAGQWYRSYGNELWEFTDGADGAPRSQHQRRADRRIRAALLRTPPGVGTRPRLPALVGL